MNRDARTTRGFTITELIVAIGVTLILLLGVSRIFSMSRETISIGEAVAEVNGRARAVERIMRDDFSAITNEGFFVIRNERIGLPLPGSPYRVDELESRRGRSPNRRFVYLNEDLEELDKEESARDRENHLGLRRLDQIVFFMTGDFATYQYRHGVPGTARNDSAPVARIWYGHGLRDPDFFDPDEPAIFKVHGMGAQSYKARFADPSLEDQVNRYAQDWILGRHQALVLPARAVPNDWQLSFAPTPLDYFNEVFLSWKDNEPDDPTQQLANGYTDLIDADLAEIEKLITEYGYVDVDRDGVVDPVDEPSPFNTRWDEDARVVRPVDDYVTDDRDRQAIGDDVSELWAIGHPGRAQGQQIRMMLAATRMRVESSPPSTRRTTRDGSVIWSDQMLTQATLAEACSHFEVAWSTGEVTYPDGDLAWYDIDNPANPYMWAWDFNERRSQTSQQRRAQAPSDARTWYLSESPAPDRAISTRERESADLHYATFGYFVPKDNDADRTDPWPWPSLIRIRMTLHDTNGRLPSGRDFEFIFRLPGTSGAS